MSGKMKLIIDGEVMMGDRYETVEQRKTMLEEWKLMFNHELLEKMYVQISPDVPEEPDPNKGRARHDIKPKYVGKTYHLPNR
jgi:hypothetical protein